MIVILKLIQNLLCDFSPKIDSKIKFITMLRMTFAENIFIVKVLNPLTYESTAVRGDSLCDGIY